MESISFFNLDKEGLNQYVSETIVSDTWYGMYKTAKLILPICEASFETKEQAFTKFMCC